MSSLLNSLEIHRFRAFRHLQIEQLGRVNLIVGKNNVGKSYLLEALQLYARKGNPSLIIDQLRAREDRRIFRRSGFSSTPEINEDSVQFFKYLFYGYSDIKPPRAVQPIRIGPTNDIQDTLFLTIEWSTSTIDENGQRLIRPLESGENGLIDTFVPRLVIRVGRYSTLNIPLDLINTPFRMREEVKEMNSCYVNANGLSKLQVATLWDNISLTKSEKDILDALRLIAPGVQGLSFVGDSTRTSSDRFPIVKITNINDPIPLRTLGDGMQRILGIALALVNARSGIVLIDEIENGIHYTVQPDLWLFIFRLASLLNAQIFATTHSWDCIKAFQKASQEDIGSEAMLIRLESKKGETSVTIFDERKLSIVTREQIEVR